MPMFTIVPEHVWIFTDAVDNFRRQALLSTSYDEIVARIASSANVGEPRAERKKYSVLGHDPGSLKRYRAEIKLSCDVVDLFHNGAGGYRAQYYESTQLGDEANDYCRSKIVDIIKSMEMANDQDWMNQAAAASLYCQTTKMWIHQGQWFRRQYIYLRNLRVPRWSCDPKTAGATRKKRWRQSMLMPDRENRIDLIGGWLRSSDQKPLGANHKPLRSQHIHCFGFT